MPDIKWVKITTDMFDDEKIRIIEALPEADSIITIWVKLICMAGKINAGGYIYIAQDLPYTLEELTAVVCRPLNTVKLAIATFQRLKMIEELDGGRIFLTNFSKHQNIEGMEKVREQTRLRVAKSREKQKLLPVSKAVTLPKRFSNAPDKIREDKRGLDIKIIKDVYGEFQNIFLSKEEFQKLTDKLNGSLPALIEEMSASIESNGYKYKSHYAALLNWARRREKENSAKEREMKNGAIPKHLEAAYGLREYTKPPVYKDDLPVREV